MRFAQWAIAMPATAALFLATAWPGNVVAAQQMAAKAGGTASGAGARQKQPAKPKAAAVAPTLSGELPTGHVGQEYQSRITGITGVDIVDFHCDPDPVVLPKGLELNCAKMLIHGHPQETVTADPAKPNVTFKVEDDDKHSVQVSLTLTILDGPDVVKLAPSGAKKQATGKAPGAAAAPAPAGKGKKSSSAGAAALEQVPEEEPAEQPVAAEAETAAVSAPAAALPSAPAARMVPAVVSHGDSAPQANAGTVKEAPKAAGQPPRQKAQAPGVGIEIDRETPVVEGASTIKGRITNDSEMKGALCVGLKRRDTTVTSAGTADSYAAITPPDGNTCPSVYVPVQSNEFKLSLTEPLRAGVVYTFDVFKSNTAELVTVHGLHQYTISLQLPVPKVEVTSLVRDGASTIAGTCKDLPNPALTTNTTATPPVTGNLPRVVVELHEPEAPGGRRKFGRGLMDDQETEWHTADLLVGLTSAQTTAQSEEALASADGCTFSVMLKTPLAAGERVRVKLKAPAGRYFGAGRCTEVVWPDGRESCDKSLAESLKEALHKGGSEGKGAKDPTGTGKNGKGKSESEGRVVYTALAVAPPVITSEIKEGTTSITGTATPSPTTGAVTIAAISDDDYSDRPTSGDPGKRSTKTLDACYSPDQMQSFSGKFLALTAGNPPATSTAGAFTLTLATPLQEGQRFHLVEVMPARSRLTEAERESCKTAVKEVKGDLDWGRIHADFVAGVLISNDSTNSTVGATGAGSGNFSQAHQFLALNVEKSWALPGCYLRIFAHGEQQGEERESTQGAGRPEIRREGQDSEGGARREDSGGEEPQSTPGNRKPKRVKDQCYDWGNGKLIPARWQQHFGPGFSTYFQTRLTAIPVSNVSMDGAASSTGSGIISTAQTARVEVGAYLPFYITRWEYDHKPNALFFAPLAKSGFDTVTGPSTVTTLGVGGATQSQSFEQVYTYWSYGARIGHMELSRSQNKAPETFSYLDIAFGPYSSLQSYVCHSNFETAATTATGSECSQYTHSPYHLTNPIDSRKRLYRFDIEGLLKIPKTILYVGLNANIGQKTLGASQLDHGFAAPDDIRFLFGTKFDIASVLTKFKLGPQ